MKPGFWISSSDYVNLEYIVDMCALVNLSVIYHIVKKFVGGVIRKGGVGGGAFREGGVFRGSELRGGEGSMKTSPEKILDFL